LETFHFRHLPRWAALRSVTPSSLRGISEREYMVAMLVPIRNKCDFVIIQSVSSMERHLFLRGSVTDEYQRRLPISFGRRESINQSHNFHCSFGSKTGWSVGCQRFCQFQRSTGTWTQDLVKRTQDSLEKIQDSVQKTPTSFRRTQNSVRKTQDSVSKKQNLARKTQDSLRRTQDSVRKTQI